MPTQVKTIERSSRGRATTFIVSMIKDGKVVMTHDFYRERSRTDAERYAKWLEKLISLEEEANRNG
jgi:hypothetical protein